tara:strand:+ start:160 stop:726 length:567 start_codon:yes stop_codon:yes gene_type:complete
MLKESEQLFWAKGNIAAKIIRPFGQYTFLLKPPGGVWRFRLHVSMSEFDNQCHVIDLTGNGSRSEYQYQGAGKFLVNTMIQFTQKHLAPNTVVFGEMSSQGDPSGRQGIDCAQNRVAFWESFGFKKKEPRQGQPPYCHPFSATLSSLATRRGKLFNECACLVSLDEFKLTDRTDEFDRYPTSFTNQLT